MEVLKCRRSSGDIEVSGNQVWAEDIKHSSLRLNSGYDMALSPWNETHDAPYNVSPA